MSSTGVAERSGLGELVRRVALPLAFLAAAAARAAFLVDPGDAAESRFLALVGTVVLLGIGALDTTRQARTGVIALLAELGLWALPPGEVRSAAISALLVLGIALVTWERVRAGLEKLTLEPVAWALAVQALCRSELYLAPSLGSSFLIEAIACPALAALAVWRMAQRDGNRLWLAILAIVVVDGGFSPELTLVLVILAASRALPRRPEAAAWIGCALALLPASNSDPFSLAVAVSVALVAALLLAERVATAGIASLLLPLAAAGLALATDTIPGTGPVRAMPSWLVVEPSVRALTLGIVALPLAVWSLLGRWRRSATGLALAAIAGCCLPPGLALAAPLVVIASSLPGRGERLELQAAWLGFLAVLGGLAASVPWLSASPLESVLRGLGPGVGIESALLAILLLGLAVTLTRIARIPRPVFVAVLGLVLIAAGVFANPRQQTVVGEATVLDSETRAKTYPLDLEISHLTVDSYASNTTRLREGTEVGRVVLEVAGGGERSLPLRLGHETGEWAARRPGLDVVAASPAPWISWPAPDGPYFAQRYRRSWTLPKAVTIRGLRIELDPAAPEDVALAVFRIGAR